MERRFAKALLKVIVVLTVAVQASTAFTIIAQPGTLPPDTEISVSAHQVEARTLRQILSKQTSSDGAVEILVDAPPGVFAIHLANEPDIPVAADEGQIIEIQRIGDALSLSGSEDAEKLLAYESFRKESLARLVTPHREKVKTAKAMGVSDSEIERLTQLEVDGYQEHLRELNDFVIDKIENSIALYATSLRWTADYRGEEIKELVDSFATRYGAEHPAAKAMRERIEVATSISLGATAPELVGKNAAGEELRLSDFRGRYVLLDFWAAWCPPCRVENKTYRELTELYPENQFTIFAVNLDTSENLWNQASRRDRITWPQISDLEGWKSPLAARYGITALPASFLIDPEGRIIAKNLRGQVLKDELASLLNVSE